MTTPIYRGQDNDAGANLTSLRTQSGTTTLVVRNGPAPLLSTSVLGATLFVINNSQTGGFTLPTFSAGYGLVVSAAGDVGLYAHANSRYFGIGVQGYGGTGVRGESTGARNGVLGISSQSNGVQGETSSVATNASGVYGENRSGFGSGVLGYSTAPAPGPGAGVYGYNSAGGYAGVFYGRAYVHNYLWKNGGGFQIDDPRDPANSYLYHSFVESPDMMNVYNGNVTTDADGNATVELPSYFEALNRDFRYQLTVIGEFAQAIVAEEVRDNRFGIKTDKPHVRVSWQVTGIRQDAWANGNRIEAEVQKPEGQRGKYVSPREHNQPETAGIFYVEPPVSEEAEIGSGQQQQQHGE
jgi:hypothetical protein